MYICWLAFEGVYLWFFVKETKGLSLEETAVLFDGDEAAEQIHAHATEQAAVAPESPSVDEKLSAHEFHEKSSA